MCNCEKCSKSPNAQGSINFCGGCGNFEGDEEEKTRLEKLADKANELLSNPTVKSVTNNPDVQKLVAGLKKKKKPSIYNPSYSGGSPKSGKSNTMMYIGIAVAVLVVIVIGYKMFKK